MSKSNHNRRLKEDWKLNSSRCGRTGKRGYNSIDAAMLAGADIMAKPDCNARTLRGYHCQFCGLYHLTSKP